MIKNNLIWVRTFNAFRSKFHRNMSSTIEKPPTSKDSRFNLNFDNVTIHSLPIDPVTENYVRTVNGACFSHCNPTPVEDPKVIAVSKSALALIDIDVGTQEEVGNDDEFAAVFSGSKLLPGSEPSAHCYCGHQFGSFAGQLGDGAAIYLGEVINKKSERWELQLKGAGPTPYSRSADGRKVLRSSLREFLASEYMAAVGVPTTRAGSCVTSSDTVIRDIFYDGNPIHEKCTIISRIAKTFLRFGSFEIFKTTDDLTRRCGPSVGRNDIKKKLLDHVIKQYYPEIHVLNLDEEDEYKEFFKQITLRTARLVAAWQCIGFCHGVLNTDNMSIVGVTIDYGPYGYLDRYDPDHICNASDDGGRYSYSKQPVICKWNLMKLAEALNPLVPFDTLMEILEQNYDAEFKNSFECKMRAKMGLIKPLEENKDDGLVLSDSNMIQLLLETMSQTGADFTNTFRAFNSSPLPLVPGNFEQEMNKLNMQLLKQSSTLNELINANEAVIKSRDFQIFMRLLSQSPRVLEQIGLSRGSIERMMSKLEEREKLKTMTSESKREGDVLLWNLFIEKYKTRLEYDVTGLSNDELHDISLKRKDLMDKSNPVITLRNHLAQKVIEAAERGDFKPTHEFLERLMSPYQVIIDEDLDSKGESSSSQEDGPIANLVRLFYEKSPEEAALIKVT